MNFYAREGFSFFDSEKVKILKVEKGQLFSASVAHTCDALIAHIIRPALPCPACGRYLWYYRHSNRSLNCGHCVEPTDIESLLWFTGHSINIENALTKPLRGGIIGYFVEEEPEPWEELLMVAGRR
jgi:hypothetical protein